MVCNNHSIAQLPHLPAVLHSTFVVALLSTSLSFLIPTSGRAGSDSGAKFSFHPSGNNALTLGQVFTVISNTAATPIAGTFHNLGNGKIIIGNGSNLQASYAGGDGNDLTLTVVL